jgi:PAS domain S-box-containing protein
LVSTGWSSTKQQTSEVVARAAVLDVSFSSAFFALSIFFTLLRFVFMVAATPLRTLHLLVVEDSDDDYAICLHFVQTEFAPNALRVDTPEEFRHALDQQQWDVILCDYTMPQFSALDALRIIRTMECDTPFIVVSGSISEEDAVRCIKAGAHDYLIKDRLVKLPHAIKREIREARAREEHRRQETLNQELYQELQHFRLALNASALVSTTDTTGTILSVNELFCRASGFEEHELLDQNHRIVNAGHHSQEFWEGFWRTIMAGTIWRGDMKNRAKDGTEYWLNTTVYPVTNADGVLYRFMAIHHIITEQKEAELRVAESELRFRTLADSAPVLVWMSDREKKCLYVSKSWLEFTGRTLEQELGDGWLDGVHPHDKPSGLKVLNTAFAARRQFSVEYRMRHHSGEYMWMLSVGAPRYLPDGSFAGYIGSCVDITQRKEAETFLQQMNEDLEQRVRERTEALTKLNEEKNEFLGIAAHDMKNPLAGIRIGAEIIVRYLSSDEKIREIAQRIIRSCDQMLDVITNLLDINRIEHGGYRLHLNSVPVQVLHNSLQAYQIQAAQKDLTLLASFAEVNVWADAQILQQVFDNLLSNAIKYSPRGKRIWVRVSIHAATDIDANDDARGQAKVWIEVQDEGPGLTKQDKEKLFTKFARLSARPTGQESSTGLGLSIVKRLVEAMQGRVWCESEHGNGATFIVELPAAST